MSDKNKVIWSEGLFLRPQHFQQHERYLERYVEGRSAGLKGNPWGFIELELERDLLAVGKLSVRRARGVFPDGTPFTMPDNDPLPPPLEIPKDARDKQVYLALPARRAGAMEIQREESGAGFARYRVGEIEVRDVTQTTGAVAPVEVGALASRLLLEGTPLDDYACIPIAHVQECRADRQVLLDENFMPSAMDLRACRPLAEFLSLLVGMFHQRGEALSAQVVGTTRGGVAEIADFLRLQTINRYQPLLEYLTQAQVQHPEDFYRLCLEIAGDLATLSASNRRPSKFSAYTHGELRRCFEPLMATLRAYLSVESISSVVKIPVELRRANAYLATVQDASLFDSASFILAVRADAPAESLRRTFSQLATVGPAVRVKYLVDNHLPGIELEHLPNAPPRIPYFAGHVYFELNRANALWADMKGSGAFGIFVREAFPNLTLEMWAIRG